MLWIICATTDGEACKWQADASRALVSEHTVTAARIKASNAAHHASALAWSSLGLLHQTAPHSPGLPQVVVQQHPMQKYSSCFNVAFTPAKKNTTLFSQQQVVEFNDIPALEAALAEGDVAAVLAEPALTNIGIVLPGAGVRAGVWLRSGSDDGRGACHQRIGRICAILNASRLVKSRTQASLFQTLRFGRTAFSYCLLHRSHFHTTPPSPPRSRVP